MLSKRLLIYLLWLVFIATTWWLMSQGNAYIGNFGFNTYSGEELKPANLILVRPGETPCVAADDLLFPNGTVITPDGKTLIVGETYAARLTAFDVNPDATLSNRRVWADLTLSVDDGETCLCLMVCV